MILLYAGRLPSAEGFPDANVPFVAAEVARLLRGLSPRLVVGSGAAGADLTVLDAAISLGIAARVVLAGSVDEFRASSVAEGWGERYRRVLASSGVEVIELPRVPGDDEASYRAVTARIWAEGGGHDESRVVLTLSGERPGGGHTEELVDLQLQAGGLALQIDPAETSDDGPRVYVASAG